MKRYLLWIFFLHHVLQGRSQSSQRIDTSGLAENIRSVQNSWKWADTLVKANYSAVDAQVFNMKKKYRHVEDLAADLAEKFPKPEDRVRAIFRWMTENIGYDCTAYHDKKRRIGKGITYERGMSKESKAELWEEVYFNYAGKALKRRKAVCEGYATLFYELCKQTGIPCEVVIGYADRPSQVEKGKGKATQYKKQEVFPTNHAWNKVFVYNTWLYLDVTWASGYTDAKVQHYTKSFAPQYYLVSRDGLYATHVENMKRSKKRNDLVGNK